MHTLERVGWISGLVLVGTSSITWLFGEIPFPYKASVMISAIVVLVITGIWHKINGKTEIRSEVSQPVSYNPFKDKESKDNYHNHLVRDICQVLEKQMQLENLPPTNSLFRLPDEKKNVILSHFFTAEYDSDKYRALYTTYRSLLEFERSMLVKSRKVYDSLEEIESYLLNLHNDNYSTTEYTLNNFFLSLGISKKTELIDFYKIKDTYQKLMGYRSVDNFKVGEEYIVRINNKDVFKSSSYDISYKCKQMLIKKLKNFENPFREAWISTNLEVYARIEQYDTTIKNYLEFIINGEPITGCCIGCLQYFTGRQKSKFEKLLGEFEDEKEDLTKI